MLLRSMLFVLSAVVCTRLWCWCLDIVHSVEIPTVCTIDEGLDNSVMLMLSLRAPLFVFAGGGV